MAYFVGKVLGSLLKAETPKEIENYSKQLLRDKTQISGLILTDGTILDDTTSETLHAMAGVSLANKWTAAK
ncbi:MAG: hypothetical protein AMJ88_07220 [Anaerolineae bacterium SM23_ 63]|nr:MAG: hypothetical protein AMJ88_07220 [Anaerolineae bacterium SM23_ 63]HEY46502.1 hypothetical protein [Anaerolineae bacterium]